MNTICNKRYVYICALIALLALLCLVVLPSFAWAVSGDDAIRSNRVEPTVGNFLGSDSKYVFTSFILGGALDVASSALDLANEFFATITGNKLFMTGIEDSSFASVMLFVGNVCNALLPIGYLVLGIFAGVEGLRILKDSKHLSSQWMGLGVMEAWLVYAIKFTVLYVLITNAKALMLAIYSLVSMIQTAIQTVVESAGFSSSNTTFEALQTLVDSVTYDQGTGSGIVFLILAIAVLTLVISGITAIYIQVLAVMRIFEIFILIAVSPVSISALVSSYTSSVASGYIKTFIGAVLQLSILFLIIAIAGPILGTVSGSINNVFQSGTSGVEALLGTVTPIVTTLAVLFMAKQSRQIADRLAGAV